MRVPGQRHSVWVRSHVYRLIRTLHGLLQAVSSGPHILCNLAITRLSSCLRFSATPHDLPASDPLPLCGPTSAQARWSAHPADSFIRRIGFHKRESCVTKSSKNALWERPSRQRAKNRSEAAAVATIRSFGRGHHCPLVGNRATTASRHPLGAYSRYVIAPD